MLFGGQVWWNEEDDSSRKELKHVQGNFCVIPLENFTMET